jgi:MATE family multidrug resistance protein
MTTTSRELRRLSQLAAPVVATQLGSMTLGVVDMLMLGRFSTEALSSSALARVWLMGTFIIFQGLLLGLDPHFSQAHGRQDEEHLSLTLQRGVVLALAMSLPLAALWTLTDSFLSLWDTPPELATAGGEYALARLSGIPAALLFIVFRGWLQGRGLMRPAMWVVLAANLFNVLANWALIFGHAGLPALGVQGAGYATALTQWVMLACLILFIRGFRLDRGAWSGLNPAALRGLWAVLKQGLPIGLHFGIEIWAFQAATLMANPFGTEAIAGHAIALNLASISFMVPLGISIAASTRVGNLIGAGQVGEAQTSANVSMGLGTAVMLFFAAVFLALRGELAALYNSDPKVIALAAGILPVAAAFQLFDGLQVVAAGILRGMGRTRILPILHLFSFYGLGLPFAWWLAYRQELGVIGIWWGLCLGLGVVSLTLLGWILVRGPASLESRRPV